MNKLEHIIADQFNKENAYFTGNGTTALYLIFKSLDMKNKKVLFPNITCMTPVNAAIYAGYDVMFCDVSKDNFTMDVQKLIQIIEKENIGIVVPTHLYGHICDMQEIYEICSERNILVIEDCAQTSYISDYNDFAITSFGHTKLFENKRGGGAILYKDKSFKELFDKYSAKLSYENNEEEVKSYSAKYYRITKSLTGDNYYSEMKKLQMTSKNIFLRHFKENDELMELFKCKESIINKRNKRIDLYEKYLNKDKFIYPKIDKNYGSTLWRLSILTKDINRNRLVDLVRKNNVDISTWYPCLHRFYGTQSDSEFSNSIEIENSIINLWVTEKYTEEKIKQDIEKINSIIRKEFS